MFFVDQNITIGLRRFFRKCLGIPRQECLGYFSLGFPRQECLGYFYLCLILVLGQMNAVAQVEQNRATYWYFGNQKGFDFSSGEPQLIEDSQIDATESCCTMSDLNGNLLFYTNGGGREDGKGLGGIWNSQNELMEGGDLGERLGGGQSAFQGCLTVPKPMHPNLYYLFTVDHLETLAFEDSPFPIGKGLAYFEIDVAANNGKGKVAPETTLLQPSFEYLAGTLHGNCIDYWVIAQTSHHYIERNADVADTFYLFQVTETGILPPKKIPMIEGRAFVRDEYGPMKISPDGENLLCGLFLYDFDKNTGDITNPRALSPSVIDPTASLSFSPNGDYLYNFRLNSIGDSTFIYTAYQYDLAIPALDSSEIIIGEVELNLTSRGRVGTPQIAPNGKIYTPFWMGKPFSKIALTSINFPDKRGMPAEFEFDQEALSEEFDQRFLRLGNFMDFIFKEKEEAIFKETTNLINLNCETQEEVILKGPPDQRQYVWSINGTVDTLSVKESGKYWVNYADGCAEGADTFLLTINNDQFDVELPEDIVFLCDNEPLVIAPTITSSSLQLMWQDSTFADAYEVAEAGQYVVEARIGLCVARDSTEAVALFTPTANLGEDTIICKGNTLTLAAPLMPYNEYDWDDGHQEGIRQITQGGNYTLTISNACGTAIDDIWVDNCPSCELYIPNVFSPNGDNQNDFFQAFAQEICQITEFSMHIIDKWGNGRVELSELAQSWDGQIQNERSAEGVYFYIAKYTVNSPDGKREFKEQRGEVTLIR